MKKSLLLLLIFVNALLMAQVSYEKRLEFEIKDGYSQEEIYEFGKLGIVLGSRNDELVNKQAEWKYEFLDTDLETVKSNTVLVDRKYVSDETYTTDQSIHTLFKHKKGGFSIVSVEAESMKITKVDGLFPKKLYVWDMKIIGDFAIFDAQIKKNSFIATVNWKTGKTNLIPISIEGFSNKKLSIDNVQVLEKSNEIFVYISVQINKKQSDLYVMKINEDGQKDKVFNFSKDIEENIISISACKIDDQAYVFTGTYSKKSTSMSEGLYFCKVDNRTVSSINFYNFLDLDNFLSYLPEKKQKRIEKRKKRKNKKGNELSIKYNIADHDIIVKDDGYIFIGECYYPTYRTETYTTTSSSNGVTSTTTHTRTVFDGYQYTHAVIAKFDKKGKMRWDKTFDMWVSNKPYYAKRFISVSEEDENAMDLVYISGGTTIVSKSIDYDNGETINEYKSEIMETGIEGDISKSAYSNIGFWYDNYFIAYGQQKIKNKTNKKDKKNKKIKRKRKVYFINKIKF